MREFAFIFLYGALAICGLFLTWFWAGLARSRAKVISHPLRKDRYFVIAASTTLLSLGVVMDQVSRIIGGIRFGLSPILFRAEGATIGPGLGLMLLGALGMVWLADLEFEPPKWRWLGGVTLATGVWAVITYFIIPFIPLADHVGS